jgi:hypothetical protein
MRTWLIADGNKPVHWQIRSVIFTSHGGTAAEQDCTVEFQNFNDKKLAVTHQKKM